MDFNLTEHIGEDGNFTEGFAPAATASLGEGYQDSKVLEGITNPAGLIKAYADTKTAYGKKLEGVIAKPGENATDEEKASYRKTMLAELGTPESPDDYNFNRPESLPDGMTYDEEFEGAFRQLFHEVGMPADMAKSLADKFNEVQVARHVAAVEQAKQKLTEEATQLDKDWPGEKSTLNNRHAFKAIMQFGTEELKTLLKEANISTNPTNHDAWNKLNISPSQRRIWSNIGAAMKSDLAINDEGLPATSNEPATAMGKIYDHPTSKTLLDKAKS